MEEIKCCSEKEDDKVGARGRQLTPLLFELRALHLLCRYFAI
jgi:hypothetical protein